MCDKEKDEGRTLYIASVNDIQRRKSVSGALNLIVELCFRKLGSILNQFRSA